MKNQSVIYVVLDGYDHIVSKATNDYEVANKYCADLCEKACNPNSYYVYELEYIEFDEQ